MSAFTAMPLEHVAPILKDLPPLPTIVRYYDDYLDTAHTIRDVAGLDRWPLNHDGVTTILDFTHFPVAYHSLLKHVVVDMLGQLDVTYVSILYGGLCRAIEQLGEVFLGNCIAGSIPEIRRRWTEAVYPCVSHKEANAVKAMLRAFCNLNVGPWHAELIDYIAKFPTLKQDKYKTVRTGDCFVPLDQQSVIIDYFDEMTALVKTTPGQVDTSVLRDTCVLIVNHQHAFRPGQIARTRVPDFRLHNTGAVHVAVGLAKQRRGEAARRVTRRVKREWCPLFFEYSARRHHADVPEGIPTDSYFLLTPDGVSDAITGLVEELTGVRWSPTDIRHTAAQRLADAGASHIALSEFMGHASIRTANVYFDTSPTQAQRVNQALALSPIYSAVAEVARTRTIDKAALLRLPCDKQIGGMPHGIPIAGIGGCAVGQSACAKNPVLSCYTCRKFMPVRDAAVHEEVVVSLRPVVLEFAEACRGNEESPAYTQLRRMLMAAQRVASDVRADSGAPPDSSDEAAHE